MKRFVSFVLALLFVLAAVQVTAGGEALDAKAGKRYTVKFNLGKGDGVVPQPQIVTAGAQVARPEDPVLTNGLFLGWYKDKACKKAWDFDVHPVKKNMTLYAKVDQVAVTFKLNGAPGKAPAKQLLIPGALVTKPADPARKGYQFKGWYQEKKGITAWNFASDKAEKNLTLYAVWAKTAGPVKPSGKTCTACGGKGYASCSSCSGTGSMLCPTCYGAGIRYSGGIMLYCPSRVACYMCGASGRKTCASCKGTGKV